MLDSSINYIEDYILGAVSRKYSTYPQQTTDSGSGVSKTYYQMCTMEEIVDKFISWSPEIVNEYSSGYVMHYDSSVYNPTYVQVKNSASLAVTLFKGREISGYRWKYVNDSMSCVNVNSVIMKTLRDLYANNNGKILSVTPNISSAEVTTVDFLSPEEVASKLSREYPPSKYSMTSGSRRFTITGRLKFKIHVKPGKNNLNPEGDYDYYSEPYYGIIDNYENKSTDKCPFTANFEVVPIYNYVDGTTYNFDGQVGQFPRLKLVGQYEEDEALEDSFTRKYTSKSLVRLRDILAIYNNKKITFRLYNFKLVGGASINITSGNCDSEYTSMLVSDPQEYVYTMISGTVLEFSISSSQVANYSDYQNFSIRTKNISSPFPFNMDMTIPNISQDIVIEIVANYKQKHCLYISAEEPMQVMQKVDGDYEVVMEEGMAYATVFTNYANNNKVDLRISTTQSLDDFSDYRYAISYYNSGTLVSKLPLDSSYYEITWSGTPTDTNEEGKSYHYFDKTVEYLDSYDSVGLWLDMKPAFKSHTVKFVLHECDISLTVDNVKVISKGSGKTEYTTNATTESKQSFEFTCTDLPSSTEVKGWYYMSSSNRKSGVNASGDKMTVSAEAGNVTVVIYLSTVNTATWKLIANSEARVYDNLGERTLTSGRETTYYTTPDENNKKIDITISRGYTIVSGGIQLPVGPPISPTRPTEDLLSANNPMMFAATQVGPPQTQSVLSDHDHVEITWQPLQGDTSVGTQEHFTAVLGTGYRFQKNNLSTNAGYSYRLIVNTYKNYVSKTITLNINHNQNVTPSVKTITGTTITGGTGTVLIQTEPMGMCYIYTMTSGSKVSFEFSIDKTLVSAYPYISGRVTAYIDSNSIPSWAELEQITFSSEGKCTLTYDFSSFSQFADAQYIIIDLETPVTTTYKYFVIGDGKVTLGVFNGDMSDPMDVSLFPKSANTEYAVFTSYDHPTQFKIKIMCDEEDLYSSYSYTYIDNRATKFISNGSKPFDEYTDSAGKHYSTFSPGPDDINENGNGTRLTIRAVYDSILYKRSMNKPYMLTKRVVGSRTIFTRTES